MAFTAVKQRPKPHKKQVAGHHKQNHHYVKHYWPYLPMAGIVSLGVVISMLWPSRIGVLGSSTDLSPSNLLSSTNQQRTGNSQAALTLNDQLNKAAQSKAEDMVHNNYWSHTSPNGTAPWTFLAASGYSYHTAGENLAYGLESSAATINAWMHSPSHRANILNQTYSQVGFGVAQSANFVNKGPTTVIVAMYAQPLGQNALLPSLTQSDVPGEVQGARTTTLPVSRVAAWSGQQLSLLPMLVACLTGLAIVTFVIRHGRFLHRNFVRGERFILAHPAFDFALVTVITVGVVISQATGFIG